MSLETLRGFERENSDSLAHHGILGMKWGVRRYQNEDGTLTEEGRQRYSVHYADRYISKGSPFYRVTIDPDDKTFDRKKYVSTTKEDDEKWQKEFDPYKRHGYDLYDVEYEAKKRLKIANAKQVLEIVNDKINESPDYAKFAFDCSERAKEWLNYNSSEVYHYPAHLLSLNFAAQTEVGKYFVTELLKRGYDGIEDMHGRNVSDDPVIVFNPDENLKRVKTVRL